MNEELNEVVEQEEQVAEAPEAEMPDEEFDAIWDSDDDGDSLYAEEAEADQPEADAAEQASEEGPEQPQPEDADQYLELKHFEEIRKVTKEEAKALAQKGMDYDRIRGKLSEAEANTAKLQRYEAFLNEMKGDFGSIDDLINDSRARLISDRENISYEEAASRVQTSIQQEQIQKMASPEAIRESMRRESLTNFLQVYPNVKAKEIPQEVWDDMKVTNNLVASYAKYEAKRVAEENKVLKQNASNKARSVGSMKSSGKGSYEKSEFDRVFDDDDY